MEVDAIELCMLPELAKGYQMSLLKSILVFREINMLNASGPRGCSESARI